ncbi:MAG TPA: MarR family transcriptional regulator [Friedmanniella sp.]
MPEVEPDRQPAVLALSGLIVAADSYRLAAANHFGLGVVDTHAISYLDAHGPMAQTALAKLMGLTSAGATGVVDRLEQAGTARRGIDPQDRRRHRIELTDRAREMLAESRTGLARVFDGLDRATLDTLVEDLPALAAGLARESERLRS